MTKNSTSNIMELSDKSLQDLCWRLHTAPGATQDFAKTFRPSQFSNRLKGHLLEVSAPHGIRLVPVLNQPVEHAVYIALPTSRTVGDLLATMFVNITPDLLLHSLRHLPEFDPDAKKWQSKVDDHINAFIAMIEFSDHRKAIEWLRSDRSRAFSLAPDMFARSTVRKSRRTSRNGTSINKTGKNKA